MLLSLIDLLIFGPQKQPSPYAQIALERMRTSLDVACELAYEVKLASNFTGEIHRKSAIFKQVLMLIFQLRKRNRKRHVSVYGWTAKEKRRMKVSRSLLMKRKIKERLNLEVSCQLIGILDIL